MNCCPARKQRKSVVGRWYLGKEGSDEEDVCARPGQTKNALLPTKDREGRRKPKPKPKPSRKKEKETRAQDLFEYEYGTAFPSPLTHPTKPSLLEQRTERR